MGTAGHVDHGKTALIQALTGIDCDTHKEEKRRGITINLGFAHLDLPGGESIGIVDVPGHKDFVHTMVGGASGIDFVLMVIAADSGVMPQTREHLRVMDILGIKHGLIALTKIDLVEDKELLELMKTEIMEFVHGTFLETSPIVEVSAKTNQGLETLIKKISQVISRVEEKPGEGIFRMFIDRVFSVSGFGTVVTGSVMSGSLQVKDKAYLLPGKSKELQVRRLERHGKEVSQIKAGDRASLNLVGLEKPGVKKGMVISDRILKETVMPDAQLELFEENVELGTWSQVIFFAGTYEGQAKIHSIDRNKIKAGETALVQIHLEEPCVLRFGDGFVIRSSSGNMTLGGGKVIDAAPLYHRKRPGKLIKKMALLAKGKLPELIAAEIRKVNRGMAAREIAFNLNISPREVEACLEKKLPWDMVKYELIDQMIFLTKDRKESLSQGIINTVKDFIKQKPLVNRGPALNEIKGNLKIGKGSGEEEILKRLLIDLTKKGTLKEMDKTWTLANDTRVTDQEKESHLQFFSNYLKNCKMQVPLMSELKREAQKRKLSERELKQILYNLTSSGEVYRVKDDYIHASVVDGCREKLIKSFCGCFTVPGGSFFKKSSPMLHGAEGKEKGFTVAQFRDVLQGNRKICLLLLAQYDSEMLTRRVGDVRVLVKKGTENE
jgi:selenocysteine-specific elongation factor